MLALPRTRARVTVAVPLLLAILLAAAIADAQVVVKNVYTKAGLVGLTVTNLGYVGNGFTNPAQPSCEYPLHSHVEHVFLGGIWVGAVAADGTIHVSAGSQDASTLDAGEELREFGPMDRGPNYVPFYNWSNSQNSDNYDPRALATQHIQCGYIDSTNVGSGKNVPLGLKVIVRALAWSNSYADDFVILDYAVINISGRELRDVYVGYWNDSTVGNTTVNVPSQYDPNAPLKWDFYGGVNGGWGDRRWWPDNTVAGDTHIWMMYEHDADGDHGMATSWVGTRFLGSIPPAAPTVSDVGDTLPPVAYNAWRFGHVPAKDDSYPDPSNTGSILPGKYQIMSNHAFTVGETPADNYTIASDWVGLMSTGPFPYMAPGDTIHATFAVVCGADSLALLSNSKVAQVAYDYRFSIPTGPPSPRLQVSTDNDRAILRWAPGDSNSSDPARRSPEYHLSATTGNPDFQGYRIYRYQGLTITSEPTKLAQLVAQYDKADGIGFDTGLPPVDQDGMRTFVDEHLLDGFPYWYSVVSFSAPDVVNNLPEFDSGFNENAVLVYPGSAVSTAQDKRTIGVYPNPYRAGSQFDTVQHGSVELGRKIWFTGLPVRCRIQVFNLAGDQVKSLDHDNPNSGQEPWDILSDPGRAIASGLYIYAVTDLATGEVQRGKLVIIK